MAALTPFLASILFIVSAATRKQDTGEECDCFRTNASTAAYFSFHRFFDFRNIDTTLTSKPSVLNTTIETTNAPLTSDFFSNSWKSDWNIQSWNNSDVLGMSTHGYTLMINSANNIYIETSKDISPLFTTYLTLRTVRTTDFQSSSEVDSTIQNYHYVSARFLARVIGPPGACAGFFTYRHSSTPESASSTPSDISIQESDIEILTRGARNKVQLTNQPSVDVAGNEVSQATANATLPYGHDWSVWNEYRLDWLSTGSAWYVNGVSVANISFQSPKDPAALIFNMWSDGGVWTGNMSIYDEAYLHVQWIEVAYNISGPAARRRDGSLMKGKRDAEGPNGMLQRSVSKETSGVLEHRKQKGCRVVCAVDEGVNLTSKGTPIILYNSTGDAPGRTTNNAKSLVQLLEIGLVLAIGSGWI